MKSIAIACVIATAASGFSGAAFARDDWQRHHDAPQAPGLAPHPHTAYRTQVQPAYSYQRVQPAYSYQYVQPAQNYNYGYGNDGYGNYGYPYAPPAYAVGGYVPHSYRQPNYYVNDWNAHNLYAPPYGHQWVRTDTGDFLLMALATGIIASLILRNR